MLNFCCKPSVNVKLGDENLENFTVVPPPLLWLIPRILELWVLYRGATII